MRKFYLPLLFISFFTLTAIVSFAQVPGIVGTDAFYAGKWLEIGEQSNGDFGAQVAPAGYHNYCPTCDYTTALAEVYDFGHDGWTVGAIPEMGDYTYPGSPFEGWEIQYGAAMTARSQMFCYGYATGSYTNVGAMVVTGAMSSYTDVGGKQIGEWAGTANAAPNTMTIHQYTEVDTFASWVVVTAKMYNTSATTIDSVYYFRSCDPDNDEQWTGGSFTTENYIDYQNDVDHRVQVHASTYEPTPNLYPLALGTKDCRAVCLIYDSWPMSSTQNLYPVWNKTYAGIYTGESTGDIAIGLVFKVGDICPGDSNFVSYTYTFNGAANGIDSALPEPALEVNNVIITSAAAPNATYDTFNTCLYPGLTTIPVDLIYATTGDWTWSKWSWSPATGLATTTGVVNSISISSLPPIITYTIIGTGYSSACAGGTGNCATRTFYLTIKTCNGATVNSPCVGGALDFNAPGDSVGATYAWVGPNSWTTTVAASQSFTITPSTWADTGTYRVIKTVGGVSDTSIAIVVLHPLPVISGPDNVCEGSTITLISSLTGTAWSSTNVATATIGATTGIVTGISPGIVVIDDSLSGCGSTYTVTVNPVAPITGVASVCMGSTTILSNAVPGGTWNSSNANATVNTTGLVSGVAAGTSTISYTTPAGCLSTVIVTVYPLAAITGTTTLCTGGTTTLVNSVAGGTWSSTNTTVATIGLTTGVVNGIAVGTSIITYKTPPGCISTTTVTVITLTTISGIQTVCQGSTTSLSDGSGGGAWSSANTGVATIGTSNGIVTGISGGTAVITYTGGSGCYTTAVVTVDPIAPITGALGMCQYFTTTLNDVLPGGVWSSSNSAVATVNSATGVVTGLTAGTSIISYKLPTTCLMTVEITVHPKPAPPAVTPPTYCQFLPANPLSATPTTGLVWYGPGVSAGSIFAPTPSTATPGITDYWVTDSTSFGCISDSTVDPVTIIPQPAPPVASNRDYCQGSTTFPLNYQVDSTSGSHLIWSVNSTGNPVIGSTPVPPSNVVTYPTGTTWYVSQVVNGCTSNPTPAVVVIVYKPSFSITESNSWVCDHDTLSFSYNGTTPLIDSSYLWQLSSGGTIVIGSATSSGISVRFDSVYGQHIISLTVGELHNMCTTTVDTQITVIALPTATGYMNPNICIGDTINLALSGESSDASIFAWYIDGVPMGNSGEVNIITANSNSGGPFSLSWNDTGSHVIAVTTTTSEGCKSLPTYDTVDVHALPIATFIFKPKSNNELCLEDSVQFIANYVNSQCSYLWQPAHGFNNDNKPVIWGKVEETQSDITLTVTDPFGCLGTSTQQLDPSACCSVLFPNAFTPNGDGKNDVFRPLFNGYHNFHSFRIVNRWGETIFESSNSLPAWDGTFNGVAQDIGTYYYYIQYDCGGNTIEAKGDVTLIR